jgi:hypothetical protein
MRKPLVTVLAILIVGIGAMGASVSTANHGQNFNVGSQLTLDFGGAYVNVVPWKQGHVSVVWSRSDVRAGLRGTILQEKNTLLLNDLTLPARPAEVINYIIESWLPLRQLESYAPTLSGLPSSHYTIYVPEGVVVDVRAAYIVIVGGRVARAEGEAVRISASQLQDGFVARGRELFVLRCTGTGSAHLAGLVAVVRDCELQDVNFGDYHPYTDVNVDLANFRARQVAINGGSANGLHVTIRDANLDKLSLFHTGDSGSVVIGNSHIKTVDNQTPFIID